MVFIYCCITQDGYKEREDRIAELEEFVNDQVAELDKMEGTMKQTIANKKILEEDYQVCVCLCLCLCLGVCGAYLSYGNLLLRQIVL